MTAETSTWVPGRQLEAELLAREDLNDRTEVEVAVQMITNLRPALSRWGGEEVQFIVDLMEEIGSPVSTTLGTQVTTWNSLNAFRNLREPVARRITGSCSPEANLTREYVRWAQGTT